MTEASTTADILDIDDIAILCDEHGVDLSRFWDHAMGGDRAALPREDVERCLAELDPDPVEYVWALDVDGWGETEGVDDASHEAACDRATSWLTEHEPGHVSIYVRPARAGEAIGLYQRKPGGDLQILGGALSIPREIDELTDRAWVHACETWPTEADQGEVSL